MGLLNFLKKPEAATTAGMVRLASGSFTVDAGGRILTSTLPRSFPEAQVRRISQTVLTAFRSAQNANLPLAELVFDFATLRLTARELRGGAIIFLAPRSLGQR